MAYRRKTRRAKRKSRRLSKHMERAIRAIALGPVETKVNVLDLGYVTYLTDSGYYSGGGGDDWAVAVNPLATIPRVDDQKQSNSSVIGDQFLLRGIRWQFNGYMNSATALNPDIQFRLTFFTWAEYSINSTFRLPQQVIDNRNNNTPTWLMYDPNVVKILWQKKWMFKQLSQTSTLINMKAYVKIRRKIRTVAPQQLITPDFVQEIKGNQIYWCLEAFAPTVTDLGALLNQPVIGTRVYFKDP